MKTQNKIDINEWTTCECGHFAFCHNSKGCKYCKCESFKEQTAQELLNETETEPFTIEERTDLNINKVTHDKVRRANK